jgi:hypothetical protein
MNASHFGITLDAWVCCSITSLTRTAQASRVRRHGRSRNLGTPHVSTSEVGEGSRRSTQSVAPGLGFVVWPVARRQAVALPDHHPATEVADLLAVLIEALALDGDDPPVGL